VGEREGLAEGIAGSIESFVHAPDRVREAVPRAVRESGLEEEWIRSLTIACYGLAMGFVAVALGRADAAHVIRSLQRRLGVAAPDPEADLASLTAAQ
jgi:hypothetical protein